MATLLALGPQRRFSEYELVHSETTQHQHPKHGVVDVTIDHRGITVKKKSGVVLHHVPRSPIMELYAQTPSDSNAEPVAFPTTQECEICYIPTTLESMVGPQSCGHKHCTACVRSMLSIASAEKKFPVPCMHSACTAEYSTHDLHTMLTPSEIAQLEYLRVLRAAMKRDHLYVCTAPDCGGILVVAPPNEMFLCPISACGKAYCIKCKQNWHTGECGTDTSAKVTSALNEVKQAMGDDSVSCCPKCYNAVQRQSGCDIMRCLCGAQFCYVCRTLYSRMYNPAYPRTQLQDGSAHDMLAVCPTREGTYRGS